MSSAERSLAAGRVQWIVLLLVAGAAVVADQLTKQVVGRTLALGENVDISGRSPSTTSRYQREKTIKHWPRALEVPASSTP